MANQQNNNARSGRKTVQRSHLFNREIEEIQLRVGIYLTPEEIDFRERKSRRAERFDLERQQNQELFFNPDVPLTDAKRNSERLDRFGRQQSQNSRGHQERLSPERFQNAGGRGSRNPRESRNPQESGHPRSNKPQQNPRESRTQRNPRGSQRSQPRFQTQKPKKLVPLYFESLATTDRFTQLQTPGRRQSSQVIVDRSYPQMEIHITDREGLLQPKRRQSRGDQDHLYTELLPVDLLRTIHTYVNRGPKEEPSPVYPKHYLGRPDLVNINLPLPTKRENCVDDDGIVEDDDDIEFNEQCYQDDPENHWH